MKRAVIISLTLHAIIIACIIIGVGNPFRRIIKDNKPMVIDFVSVSEISAAQKLSPINQKKQSKSKPEAEKNEKSPPVEEKKTPEDLKQKPMQDTKAEPKLESKAEPNKETKVEPKPEIKEKPKPESKPEQKPEVTIDPNIKKISKKDEPEKKEKLKELSKPKKDEKKKERKSKLPAKAKKEEKVDKALINLQKTKKSEKSKTTDIKEKAKTKSLDELLDTEENENDSREEGSPAESIGLELTANEIDAVRQAIRKCWTFNSGTEGAKDFIVDIEMEIDPDGTVKKAEIIDKDRFSKDPAFRIAAENARRSVIDPNCNPLPLPAKKYEQWKTTAFRFNPKDM